MPIKLPGWVVDDVTSVRREVEHLRGLTPEEGWELGRRCARDALWALRLGDHAEKALAHRDAVPESTRAALERLRQETGWGVRAA